MPSYSAVRDATYTFVIVLGLVFCSSFPRWSNANEVMEGRIEVLFFGHAQVFQAEPMHSIYGREATQELGPILGLVPPMILPQASMIFFTTKGK